MIDAIALKIATTLKRANEEETPSIEVMKFALIIVLNTLMTVLLSLFFGWITGKFLETLTVMFCFVLLRFFSGGLHLKSAVNCTISSTLTIVLIPHIPLTDLISYIMVAISLFLILLFAPSDIRHSRLPEKYFPVLKFISLAVVLGTVFFSLHLLSLTYFVQSVSLIRFKKGGVNNEETTR